MDEAMPLPETRTADHGASPIAYLPQLNTLRAFAVGLVFLEHYLPTIAHYVSVLDGVLLFFVLSGFLITKILLGYREQSEQGQAPKFAFLRTFYIRRTLRIFPAYYLLIFIMIALGVTRAMAVWHLTYTTNFWCAAHNAFPDDGEHFWTLAVEEQFYLVWPLFVLMAPKRALPWIMAGGVISSLGFRVLATELDWGLARRTLTIGNLYALLGGGLWGWVHHNAKAGWIAMMRRYGWLSIVALPLLLIEHPMVLSLARPVVLTLLSIYLIDQCVKGYRGWLGWFMSLPPLLYLGTISYGLYLYHVLVRHLIGAHFFMPFGRFLDAMVWTLATIAVASASWFLFEKPINALKARFSDARVKGG